jgi:hypothetical protein
MELHRLTDKFEDESDILIRMLERLEEDPSETALSIALSQAKRVRRESNVLVRALARERDNKLQPQEAQAR